MLLKAILSKQQISSKGILYSWGVGNAGQLGDSTNQDRSSPVAIVTQSWKQISNNPRASHVVAIRSDSTLWAWGKNDAGQLGNNSTISTSISSPVIVNNSIWSKISIGQGHILAIKSDGSLWSWGFNEYGELGNLSTGVRNSPTLVSGPASTSWSAAVAGQYLSLALTTEGRLYAWGYNDAGQLGDLTTVNKSSPVLVSGPAATSWSLLPTCIQGRTALAITTTGRLYAWGNNESRAIGDLTSVNKSSPVLVSGPAATSWSLVSVGAHVLATTSQGRLYAWGNNFYGELGILTGGLGSYVSSPLLVSGPAGASWVSLSAGGQPNYNNFSLGITTTGQLYGWGYNGTGSLGDLTTVNKSSPVLVSGPAATSWSAIANSWQHSLAISTTGRLYAWGANAYGQLGDLTSVNKSSPVLVSGPAATSWSAIAASPFYESIALNSSNQLYFWGSNDAGYVPIGQSSPVQIGTSSWSAVGTGASFSVGITTEGRLYAWGSNSSGQLGDLTTVDKSSPVLVSGPAATSWSLVTGGVHFALAVTNAGRLYAWGNNFYGTLGDTTTVGKSSAVLVSGPASTSWTSISADLHVLAVSTQGRLYAWGYNGQGQLGDLTTVNKSSPVLVSGPAATSWAIVKSGSLNSFAISTLGRLYAWGYNTQGQLGDLTTVDKISPVLVSGPAATSWSAVATGSLHTLGVTTNGRLYAWGYNTQGQLGDLTTVNKSSPVLVSGPAATSWSLVGGGWLASLAITNLV